MSKNLSRKGISLIVVLSMMIAATLMGTAVYYAIQKYNARSGENLYSESALAANKAGEAATKAWFSYEGNQAVSLVNAFLDPANAGKPIQINMGSEYSDSANLMRQTFETYLVDVFADTSSAASAALPVMAKVVIKAVGQNLSESYSTVVYKLDGLSYQKPPVESFTGTATIGGKDAMFIGNGALRNSGQLVIKGSLYVQDSMWNLSTGKITVTSDLVFGSTNPTFIDGPVIVGNDLYVGGHFWVAPTGSFTVAGNAYFNQSIWYVDGPMTISGDAYFADSVGSVYLGNPLMGFRSTVTIDGNATFMKEVGVRSAAAAAGNLIINGDAGFYGTDNVVVEAGAKLKVAKNAKVWAKACFTPSAGSTIFGTDASNFLHTRIKGTNCPTSNQNGGDPTSVVSTWDGWVANPLNWPSADTITDANQLTAIRSTITAASTYKKAPFGLSDSIIDSKKIFWKDIVSEPNTFNDNAKTHCDGLLGGSAKTACNDSLAQLRACDGGLWSENIVRTPVLQCVIDKMPDFLKYNGYAVLDMTANNGEDGGFSNSNTATEKITGNAILLIGNTTAHIPPTSSTGRLLIYFKPVPGAGTDPVIGIAGTGVDTCNCIIYSNTRVGFSRGHFIGTTILDFNPRGFSYTEAITDSLTFEYNPDVISDLAIAGVFTDSNGVPIAPPPPILSSATYTVSLLSPRLTPSVVSYIYGPTTSNISAGNVSQFNRALILTPRLISVKSGEYSSWTVLLQTLLPNSLPTHFYKPDSSSCSPISLVTASQPDDSKLDSAGSYNLVYKSTCSHDSPSANLTVWIKPTGTAALSGTVVSSVAASSGAALSSITPVSSSSSANVSSSSYLIMGSGSIAWNKWTNVPGNLVSDIPTTTTPNSTGTYLTFDAPHGTTGVNDYGLQVRGYVFPPVSGSYTFYIASDDGGQLWLSTDSSVANRVPIADNCPGLNGWDEWKVFTKCSSQTSSSISLIAGHQYYIEAQMKQATGGYNLSVAWLIPGTMSLAIIDGAYLSPYYSSNSSSSSSTSVSSSSKANTPPYGGACNVDYNARTVGQVTAVTNPTAWSDSTYLGTNVVQYTFDNGSTWTSSASNTWAATTGSPYTIKMRATDPNGAVSALVTCGGGNPVTVTGASSSSSSLSSSSSGAATTITTWGDYYSFPQGTSNIVMNVVTNVPSGYASTTVKFYCTVSSSGNATVTFTVNGLVNSAAGWQAAQVTSVPMGVPTAQTGTIQTPDGAAVCHIAY